MKKVEVGMVGWGGRRSRSIKSNTIQPFHPSFQTIFHPILRGKEGRKKAKENKELQSAQLFWEVKADRYVAVKSEDSVILSIW